MAQPNREVGAPEPDTQSADTDTPTDAIAIYERACGSRLLRYALPVFFVMSLAGTAMFGALAGLLPVSLAVLLFVMHRTATAYRRRFPRLLVAADGLRFSPSFTLAWEGIEHLSVHRFRAHSREFNLLRISPDRFARASHTNSHALWAGVRKLQSGVILVSLEPLEGRGETLLDALRHTAPVTVTFETAAPKA